MFARNFLGFSMAPNMHRIMETNGFFASIMRADKKTKDNDGLPTGMPIPVLPVDYLKDRPDFWVGGIGSYVCPVDADWGLWFNWTMNRHDTGVLTSVKGMNPITGQRINGLGLEQYKTKCPVHDKTFKHGRFCEECNFKWPEQNYVSAPNPLYWDGFRSSDGQVRQFYFTPDMAKSVPELVIGKEDTVPAFGFCFYQPKKIETFNAAGNRLKEKFPECELNRPIIFGRGTSGFTGPTGSTDARGYRGPSARALKGIEEIKTSKLDCTSAVYFSSTSMDASCSAGSGSSFSLTNSAGGTTSPSIRSKMRSFDKMSITSSCDVGIGAHSVHSMLLNAEVGVGAGAAIKQSLTTDKRSLEDWNDKPAGVIRVYFVFREQFEKYVSAGFHDLTGSKEGFLAGVPVGGVK
jgi:hypothetical protein